MAFDVGLARSVNSTTSSTPLSSAERAAAAVTAEPYPCLRRSAGVNTGRIRDTVGHGIAAIHPLGERAELFDVCMERRFHHLSMGVDALTAHLRAAFG